MLYFNSTFFLNYNQYWKEPLWYLYFYNSCCKFSNHSKKFIYMFSLTFVSITSFFLYFNFEINFNFSIYYNFYSVYYLNTYFSLTVFYSKYALRNNFFVFTFPFSIPVASTADSSSEPDPNLLCVSTLASYTSAVELTLYHWFDQICAQL